MHLCQYCRHKSVADQESHLVWLVSWQHTSVAEKDEIFKIVADQESDLAWRVSWGHKIVGISIQTGGAPGGTLTATFKPGRLRLIKGATWHGGSLGTEKGKTFKIVTWHGGSPGDTRLSVSLYIQKGGPPGDALTATYKPGTIGKKVAGGYMLRDRHWTQYRVLLQSRNFTSYELTMIATSRCRLNRSWQHSDRAFQPGTRGKKVAGGIGSETGIERNVVYCYSHGTLQIVMMEN
jgi:hypothetical protein